MGYKMSLAVISILFGCAVMGILFLVVIAAGAIVGEISIITALCIFGTFGFISLGLYIAERVENYLMIKKTLKEIKRKMANESNLLGSLVKREE